MDEINTTSGETKSVQSRNGVHVMPKFIGGMVTYLMPIALIGILVSAVKEGEWRGFLAIPIWLLGLLMYRTLWGGLRNVHINSDGVLIENKDLLIKWADIEELIEKQSSPYLGGRVQFIELKIPKGMPRTQFVCSEKDVPLLRKWYSDGKCKIGFEAKKEISIDRKEIYNLKNEE